MKLKILIAILLLVPLLVLLPGIADFAYPVGSDFSDLTISHYPNLVFLRQSIADGSIPLWSDTILSGYPFAANPLASLWYPPGWLLLALPAPFGFNLLVILHLWWGGLGMYLLLRAMNLDRVPSLAGALIFELLPKSFAHYAAGHVTLLFALAWTPWLLLAERRKQDRGGFKISLMPGLVMGLILLADVRWGIYAAILWAFYSLWVTVDGVGNGKAAMRWARHAALQGVIAGSIAAPLLLPLMEYTRLSTRSEMTAADSLGLALQPAGLLGLLFPDFGAYAEWMLYLGAPALLLSIWVMLTPSLRRRCHFWIILFFVSLLIAVGPAVPILSNALEYLARLPVLNLLRVPTRALFWMGLAAAVMTAEAVQSLWVIKPIVTPRRRFGPDAALVALASFALLLTLGVFFITGSMPAEFLWGAAALVIFSVLILLRQRSILPARTWALLLLPLLVLDLAGTGYLQVDFRDPQTVHSEGRAAAEYLAGQEGDFRVYSPSYSIPQQTAAELRLHLADGVDPMMLRSYVQFMDSATGVPRSGYSVTLPPLEGEDVHQVNRAYQPDARLLGLLNVRFVTAEFPLDTVGLVLSRQFGSTWVYANDYWLPRAWVQYPGSEVGQDILPADFVRLSPNRIEVRASGPGLLVLSEVDYPGWQVRVDGAQREIQPVIGLLRGVELPEGPHVVIFEYLPAWLYAGLALAAVGILAVLLTLRRKP